MDLNATTGYIQILPYIRTHAIQIHRQSSTFGWHRFWDLDNHVPKDTDWTMN